MRIRRGSRTFRLVKDKVAPIVVALVAVSGCGDDPDGVKGSPILRVVPQATAGSADSAPMTSAESGPADSRLMAPVDWEFVVDGALDALDGSADAYVFAAGLAPRADDMARLASALGVEADFVRTVFEEGTEWEWTNWVAGPSDGTGPSITIGEDALQSWWFSTGFGEASAESPRDLPSKKEAERSFLALMDDLGVSRNDLVVESYVDDWSAGVWAYRSIGGVRSSMVYSATFGEGGELTFASGQLAEPEQFAEYPRIGTEAGLERLRDMYQSPEFGSGVDDATRDKVTVEIDGVEEELVFLWGADGEVYLVPGYAFTSDDGMGGTSRFSVTAIADRFVEEVAPVDVVPMPIEDGIGDGSTTGDSVGDSVGDLPLVEPPTDDEIASFVGLTEAEAGERATASGWTVRIAARDGEQFQLTMDYRPERINLTIEAGTVTAAFGG